MPEIAMPRLEILLVDDDPLVRNVIAHELEEAGHFVTSVASGQAALELLKSNGDFHLVLVDYTMPGMSGSDLVREIRSFLPEVKAAILTGFSQLPSGEEPPCAVITKGLRMIELIKAVEAAAAGRPVNPAYNATATRVDLLVGHMMTEPALNGVKGAMHEAYNCREGDDAVPDEMASVLERLPPRE
jgi:CheY-like chemotaxis protein